jgi:hypothetical protein
VTRNSDDRTETQEVFAAGIAKVVGRLVGHDPRVVSWGLMSMALFRQDPKSALRFLEDACPKSADPTAVLEPDGPWPFPEGWRRAFHRGTTLLMLGGSDRSAAMELHHAEAIEPTAEGANNLGVALARLGYQKEAATQFSTAIDRKAGYYDAGQNAAAESPEHLTTHPLRRAASRTESSRTASRRRERGQLGSRGGPRPS